MKSGPAWAKLVRSFLKIKQTKKARFGGSYL
jgi:hypothetical protein